ncbi:Inhibitor of growth protein [Dirofilaria immitis]|nr:Inhibitor of growth protein [Dirofilaria immitis]
MVSLRSVLFCLRSIHTSCYMNKRGPLTIDGWYPRDHMPDDYPKNEEERRAAAIKYGMRPEDYKPYDKDDYFKYSGNYPDYGCVTYDHKDPYENWSDPHYRRNWGEGMDQHSHFLSSFNSSADLLLDWYSDMAKGSQMLKQYPYDIKRAYPFTDPRVYPITNYTIAPRRFKVGIRERYTKGRIKKQKGLLLGKDKRGYFIADGYQHTLLFAPTGSGKGVVLDQLPGELRDRSTEVRMLDLQAQQLHERANKERDEFFATGGTLPHDIKVKRYNKILELYAQAKALSDEKVAILDVCHSLLLKYSQKLNKEILHFKLELEADNPGITEQIERRRRKYREASSNLMGMINGTSNALSETSSTGSRGQREQLNDSCESGQDLNAQTQQSGNHSLLSAAGTSDTEPGPSGNRAHSAISERDSDLPPLKVIVYYLIEAITCYSSKIIGISNVHSSTTVNAQPVPGTIGDSWNGTAGQIPSISSQTQFSMNPPKNSPNPANFIGISGHSTSGQSMMSLAVQESRHGRPRKLTSRAQEMLYTMQRHERRATSLTSYSPELVQGSDDESDSDRRVWCFCREKGYGSMVACDDPACRYEWFHYGCVNVIEKPKGKWYCPECAPKHSASEMSGISKA